MKRWSLLLALILLLGCQQTEDITLGGAFALSSYGSLWGDVEMKAVQLAIADYNEEHGTNVQLVIEDTGTNGKGTVNAVYKLIDVNGVDGIIGPTWLDSFLGAPPIAEEKEVIMITPSASISAIQKEGINEHVFSTWYRAEHKTKALAEHFTKTGKTRIGLLLGLDPFWEDAKVHLEPSLTEAGLEVVFVERVTDDVADYKTLLTKLPEADAIFFGVDSKQALLTFLKQEKELGFQTDLYTAEYIREQAVTHPDLAEGIYFYGAHIEAEEFEAAFREAYDMEPQFSAYNAYDATIILLTALHTEDPLLTLQTGTFSTITYGNASFDAFNGLTGATFSMNKVSDGQVEILDLIPIS